MTDGWFKQGHKNESNPHYERPIGTLRVNDDGYLERKVRNDLRGSQRWRAEHVLVWEKAHGPLPPGHVVVFKGGNKRHIDLSNLECISRAELMRRNSIHARRTPEQKEAIFALNAVKSYITKKEKRRGKKQAQRSA